MSDPLSTLMVIGGTLLVFWGIGADKDEPKVPGMVLGAALVITGALLQKTLNP